MAGVAFLPNYFDKQWVQFEFRIYCNYIQLLVCGSGDE